MIRFAVIGASAMMVACGGSRQNAVTTPATPVAAAPQADAAPRPHVLGSDALRRSEVDQVLGEGLGRFFQRVETAPVMERGKFVGYRVVRFRRDDALSKQTAVLPGDVVTKINGVRVERPEQAFQVWNELQVASGLTVELLRKGAPKRVTWTIVGDPAPVEPPAAMQGAKRREP